jgi:hypothetical protein
VPTHVVAVWIESCWLRQLAGPLSYQVTKRQLVSVSSRLQWIQAAAACHAPVCPWT